MLFANVIVLVDEPRDCVNAKSENGEALQSKLGS